MHDPESLAELLEDFDPAVDGDGAELGFAADEAHEALTGAETPGLGLAPPPPAPQGVPLDVDDDRALAERLPRLWDRFGARSRSPGTPPPNRSPGAPPAGAADRVRPGPSPRPATGARHRRRTRRCDDGGRGIPSRGPGGPNHPVRSPR